MVSPIGLLSNANNDKDSPYALIQHAIPITTADLPGTATSISYRLSSGAVQPLGFIYSFEISNALLKSISPLSFLSTNM